MSRLQILYVDDSPLQLDEFRKSLHDSDCDLVTVQTTRDAERVAGEREFDLVVIDYNLGTETGDRCLAALRPKLPSRAKFFLYTSDTKAFRRHREMGFDGVLMLKGKASVRSQIDVLAKAAKRATFG